MAIASPNYKVATATLRKLLALTGLVPLALFLAFHAYQQSALLQGRDALLARLDASPMSCGLSVLLLAMLLVHATCGAVLATRQDAALERTYGSRAFRSFQAVTGALTLAFLLLHVGGTLWARLSLETSAGAYGVVLDQTGTTPGMAAYVVGISAACLHLGQGLAASILRFWPTAQVRIVRGCAGLAAGFLWLTFFRALAVYATSTPLM